MTKTRFRWSSKRNKINSMIYELAEIKEDLKNGLATEAEIRSAKIVLKIAIDNQELLSKKALRVLEGLEIA